MSSTFADVRFSKSYALDGVKFVESEAATALPSGKPRTDDMRAMVEHMEKLGLIRRKPAAFQVGNTMVIHPVLAAQLRRHVSQRVDSFMENAFANALYGRAR